MGERTFGARDRAGPRDADRRNGGVTGHAVAADVRRGRAKRAAAAAPSGRAGEVAAIELAERLVDCVSAATRDWATVAELAAALVGVAEALSGAGRG